MAGLIRAQGLCKTYGTGENEVHALLPCDMKIREGETVAVTARRVLTIADGQVGGDLHAC